MRERELAMRELAMREREPTRPTSDATYQALSHELLAKEPEKTNEGEKRRNYFTRLRRTLYHHGAPLPICFLSIEKQHIPST